MSKVHYPDAKVEVEWEANRPGVGRMYINGYAIGCYEETLVRCNLKRPEPPYEPQVGDIVEYKTPTAPSNDYYWAVKGITCDGLVQVARPSQMAGWGNWSQVLPEHLKLVARP